MKNTKIRFATLAAVLVLAIMSSASQVWAQQVRLSARKNKVINGIEAQLRGDYRERTNPIRLNSELENINLPVGTPVAFCLVQNGVKTKIGVGQVATVGGIQVASVELAVADGDNVPSVKAGDVLQARQSKTAPFKTSPGCGSPLLVGAPFN
ncbi:MAG: hypothetical protein HY233_06945 [Acidobacteriales bacterium]|nr:hypothetical protein [Terriglobales bacterium]